MQTCQNPTCQKPLTAQRIRYHSKYCRKACRIAVWEPVNPRREISTGNTGAASELMVSADLLLRGYEVFRAVSQSCSCDLIAHRAGQMLRIEVRTGTLCKSGKVSFPFKTSDVPRSDIIAIVLPEGHSVTYRPDLPQ